MKTKYDLLIQHMENKEIFSKTDYTFYEYVDELLKFQNYSAGLIFDGSETGRQKIYEVISKVEEDARKKNLQRKKEIREMVSSLNILNKEISIAMAGVNAENRIDRCLQHVNREDIQVFKSVYLQDAEAETEIDKVILTKSGIIVLEIKNAKEDITIDRNGRILFNNSSCYHDISIGDKMECKRRLLRNSLEQAMRNSGVEFPVDITSFVVFSTPHNKRVKVTDLFGKERYCFKSSINRIVENHDGMTEMTEEEYEVLSQALATLETRRKGFALPFDPDEFKQIFANGYLALYEGNKKKMRFLDENHSMDHLYLKKRISARIEHLSNKLSKLAARLATA